MHNAQKGTPRELCLQHWPFIRARLGVELEPPCMLLPPEGRFCLISQSALRLHFILIIRLNGGMYCEMLKHDYSLVNGLK